MSKTGLSTIPNPLLLYVHLSSSSKSFEEPSPSLWTVDASLPAALCHSAAPLRSWKNPNVHGLIFDWWHLLYQTKRHGQSLGFWHSVKNSLEMPTELSFIRLYCIYFLDSWCIILCGFLPNNGNKELEMAWTKMVKSSNCCMENQLFKHGKSSNPRLEKKNPGSTWDGHEAVRSHPFWTTQRKTMVDSWAGAVPVRLRSWFIILGLMVDIVDIISYQVRINI